MNLPELNPFVYINDFHKATKETVMNSNFFQIIFGLASIYFGWYTLLFLPTLFQLLAALIARRVKWPGPRVHDLSGRKTRERLGIGYENLFSTYSWYSTVVFASLIFSTFSLLSVTPYFNTYILIKSPVQLLILSLFAIAGGIIAVRKGMPMRAQIRLLLSDLAHKVEPRAVDGQSAEAEFAIEHPLIGKRPRNPDLARAINQFYESIRCHQDGNEMRAMTLYREALTADPDLHTHAREALNVMINSSSPTEVGAIYYWLGIHAEYMRDYQQARIWYEKAADALLKIGYKNRASRAHCNLGNVKMHLGDPSGKDEFEQAIALNPKNGIAYINIAWPYYINSEPGDELHEWALDKLAEAVLADPDTYGPIVLARLRSISYIWKQEMEKICELVAQKSKARL